MKSKYLEDETLGKYNDMFKWPGIDDFNAPADGSKYLFKEEEKRIYELLDQAKASNDTGMAIAVTGERGNGKTSFLLRIRKKIIQDNIAGTDKNTELWVLPIVNPSYFSDHLSILEILVSSIQSDLKIQKEKHASEDYVIEAIEMSIENVGDIIAQMRVSRSKSASVTSTQDYIHQSSGIINLSKKISDLINKYLKFLSMNQYMSQPVSRLVLIVDDLDLVDNDLIYKAWLDIQNILSATPLVMILSYRETQLRQALDHQLISENSKLLEQNQINMEEIRSRVTAKIEKQVPDQHKVMLKSAQEILQSNIVDLVFPFFDKEYAKREHIDLKKRLMDMVLGSSSDLIGEIDFNQETAEQWLNSFFEIRLGMRWTPLAGYEKVDQLKPISLREFVDLFQMTVRIADILSTNNNYSSALLIAKDYYLNRAKKFLPQDLNEALLDFDHAQIDSKNMVIYSKLYNLEGIIRNSDDKLKIPEYMTAAINVLAKESALADNLQEEPILQASIALAKDVSLGDVIHIISLLEMQCERSVHLGMFFATIKLLYSVELQLELADKSRTNDEAAKGYAALINGIFMPEEYSYFAKGAGSYAESNNELMVKYDADSDIANELKDMRYTKYASNSDYGRYKLDGMRKHVGNNLSQAIRYSNQPYFVTEVSEEEHVSTARYRIDFYAPLVKEDHVEGYIKALRKAEDSKKLPYVLRDTFDVDYFMMHQYTKKPQLVGALKEVVDNVSKNILEVQKITVQKTEGYAQEGTLYKDLLAEKESFLEIDTKVLRKSIFVTKEKNQAVIELEKNLVNAQDGQAPQQYASFAREELKRVQPIIEDVVSNSGTSEVIRYQGALLGFIDGDRKQYNMTVRREIQDLYSKLKNLANDTGEDN